MGFRISRVVRTRHIRVLILGLDAAGKTTLLNWLKTGRTFDTIPTIGFNVDRIKVQKEGYASPLQYGLFN